MQSMLGRYSCNSLAYERPFAVACAHVYNHEIAYAARKIDAYLDF